MICWRTIFDKWMITFRNECNQNYEFISHCFWWSLSAFSTNNVKKGIICNYIPNIKALTQVFIDHNTWSRMLLVIRILLENYSIVFPEGSASQPTDSCQYGDGAIWGKMCGLFFHLVMCVRYEKHFPLKTMRSSTLQDKMF